MIETVRSTADGVNEWTGMAGTPAYMAPEQARGHSRLVDERADVFGLGGLLCVILTGQPPYVASSRPELLDLAESGDITGAYARLDACGADPVLVSLCKRCLARQIEARPRNAEVVAQQVASYQAEARERSRREQEAKAKAEVERRAAVAEQEAAEAREKEARATAEANRRMAVAERNRRRVTVALAATVLLAAGVGGMMYWSVRERNQKADITATAALDGAKDLFEKAKKAGPRDSAAFDSALDAAHSAKQVAGMQGVTIDTRDAVERHLLQVREEVEQTKRDRRLLVRLLEARMPREVQQYLRDHSGMLQEVARTTPDEDFAAAFKEWGLKVGDPVAASVKARPRQTVMEIVAGLDEWAWEKRQRGEPQEKWVPLHDLATALDASGDVTTQRLRDILRNNALQAERAAGIVSLVTLPLGAALADVVPGTDRNELRRMAQRAEIVCGPVLRILTLARALELAGDVRRAEQLLKDACQAHPQEVILYQTLGNLLVQQKPPRWRDAVIYYQAARALRSELGVSLSKALQGSDRVSDGLILLRELATQAQENPGLWWICAAAHWNVALALQEKANQKPVPIDLSEPADPRLRTETLKSEAFSWYRKAAEQGDAAAQHNIGFMYENGDGVRQDDKQAVIWYRKAATQGVTFAQNALGLMYERGRGVQQNHEEAVLWYRKAAAQGYARAEHNLALAYTFGRGVKQDDVKAVIWYRRAAERGYADGQYNLGVMFDKGRGLKQDEEQAVLWYRKAAENGNVRALFNLGMAHANGHGVKKDDMRAASWYRKAAEKGHAQAQHNLGWMYALGRGVKKDQKEAVFWLCKAAAQDVAAAQYNLAVMYANGRGVEQSDEQALLWYRKAAEQGYVSAQFTLGMRYETGRGVKQDDKQAASWFQKAAEKGHDSAQFKLGWMYGNGRGVQRNDEQAVFWYRKAAANGHVAAQFNLGLRYQTGRGVKQDDKQAVTWFYKAAEKGNEDAAFRLGMAYENGRGVKQDDAQALRWYRKASSHGNISAQFRLARIYQMGRGVPQSYTTALQWYAHAAAALTWQALNSVSVPPAP